MCEYGVINKTNEEKTIFFGYDFADACRRAGADPTVWKVEYEDYVD